MKQPWFECQSCGAEYPLSELYRCSECGGELATIYDYASIDPDRMFGGWMASTSMWHFADLLPSVKRENRITLGEGGTPLVRSHRLAEKLGLKELYFKLESCNPTGSFKDRQVSVAISKANEWGRRGVGTASSGNVGVALSAYSARAGFNAHVWVSEDTAASKVQQIQVYGARLFLVPDPAKGSVASYRSLYTDMQRFCVDHGMVPMVSARPVNPFMVEGSKTISFEIVAALGRVPDRVFLPVGGGGFLGGAFKGFKELVHIGAVDRVPHFEGGQRTKYMTPINDLDNPAYQGGDYFEPLDGRWAWESLQESNGVHRSITDRDIRAAQAELARMEGIFAEPQGAMGAAALLQAGKTGQLSPDEVVVCVVTGMGLKDMKAAREICELSETAVHRVESLQESAPYVVA